MRCRLVHPSKNIDKIVSMAAPRKVELISHWFKQARKVLPEIPDTDLPPFSWRIQHQKATESHVIFELVKGGDNRKSLDYDYCYVVIDRKASSLGA